MPYKHKREPYADGIGHKNVFLVGNLCLAPASYGLKMTQPRIRNARGSRSCFHAFLCPMFFGVLLATSKPTTTKTLNGGKEFGFSFPASFPFSPLRYRQDNFGCKDFSFCEGGSSLQNFCRGSGNFLRQSFIMGALIFHCRDDVPENIVWEGESSGRSAGSAFCWNTAYQSRVSPAGDNLKSALFAPWPFCFSKRCCVPIFSVLRSTDCGRHARELQGIC